MPSSILSIPQLLSTSVAVLGFGRAGRYVVDFLLSRGCAPTVYTETVQQSENRATYEACGVRFCAPFPDCFCESVLVRSPGIRPDIAPIRRALAMGAHLTGECDLFLANTAATVIGVTGSDGKTTTANMIAELLRAMGHAVLLGGNNGAPLLFGLDTLGERDFAVVELSSFQLMSAPAPDVAVITNLVPNHLNWHLDFEEYATAKCRIVQGASRLVTNADLAITRGIGARATIPVTWFGTGVEPDGEYVLARGEELLIKTRFRHETVSVFRDFRLLGAHNKANFATAVAAVEPFVDADTICRVAKEFKGVSHRMQSVATVDGVEFINSSIDTSPSRTVAALSALGTGLHVIVGGRGKGVSLAPLCEALVSHARAVYAYGELAKEIEVGISARVPCARYDRFADAFFASAKNAVKGERVLLSPGGTAFDQFRDFEERGEVFCRLVKLWEKERKYGSGTS